MSSYATEVVRQLVKVSAIDTERGSTLTPWLGAVPYAGPALASMAASATAPPGEHILRGTGAGGHAALMALLGTIPGAALGAPIGALIDSHDRGRGAAGGATVGAILGSMAGGAYGAHTGRRLGIEDAAALRQQAAEMARKKESAVNENLFILRGKRAAVEKLGIGPLLGLIGRGALAGGLGGAIPGAISGAIAAPEGRGWSGAARGALGGAAGGALLGGAAGGFAGRGLSAAGKRTLSGIASPVRAARAGEEGTARVQQILARQPQLQQPFARGAAGVAGGSLIGGITGGAMAAPSPEPTRMQQFQQLLQKTHGSMAGTGMPFLQ